MTKCVCWKCKLERSFETYASLLGGDSWRIWLSTSFWNQFLGASDRIVLGFFKHLLCPSGAAHHWSVIAYPIHMFLFALMYELWKPRVASVGTCCRLSWPALSVPFSWQTCCLKQVKIKIHSRHVMIVLAWPAQHFQQLRIILRGRRSTWSTLWFFCVASAAFSAAKDHFAWQAQHLKHVMIKKWHAAVGKPAIVTCFARLKKLK